MDLAGGLGRHALWLATRTWKMSLVDVSDVAIGKVRRRPVGSIWDSIYSSRMRRSTTFGAHVYDLVVLFYRFRPKLFPKVVSALNPGGFLICKMAMQWHSR